MRDLTELHKKEKNKIAKGYAVTQKVQYNFWNPFIFSKMKFIF